MSLTGLDMFNNAVRLPCLRSFLLLNKETQQILCSICALSLGLGQSRTLVAMVLLGRASHSSSVCRLLSVRARPNIALYDLMGRISYECVLSGLHQHRSIRPNGAASDDIVLVWYGRILCCPLAARFL